MWHTYNLVPNRSVSLCLHRRQAPTSLVPYLKLCGLLTQSSISSTSYRLKLNGRKAFHRTFYTVLSPCSISFNDFFEAFQRFAAICSPLITEPHSTCSQAYHSDYSVTGPINWTLLIILTRSKPRKLIYILLTQKLRTSNLHCDPFPVILESSPRCRT